MSTDFFDQIASGEIPAPAPQPPRYSVRMNSQDSLAFLRVGSAETDLTAHECHTLALDLLRIADELEGGAYGS